MIHDPDLPELARSLEARQAMLAGSVSKLADAPPLIASTVAEQLVIDLGFVRANRVASLIVEEVLREGQRQQYRGAFEASPICDETSEEMRDVSGTVTLLLVSALIFLCVMAALGYHVATAALDQRDLYRALANAAPAYLVTQ